MIGEGLGAVVEPTWRKRYNFVSAIFKRSPGNSLPYSDLI